MSSAQLETMLVVAAAAAACAVLGCFLVLRRMALLSDAIGHVLLLGVVLAFFVTRDLKSPLLMFGAAAAGLVTVALVERLTKSGYVKEDAAIGLVFPALFAAGVLLVTLYAKGTHLDVDRVLLGVPELAWLRRMRIGGVDVGPYSLVVMANAFAVDAAVVLVFFKELKLTTFDAGLAATLGFLPGVVHYGLMGLVSLTAVAAFDATGPVLVVAFFVVPPATAYLWTDRLARMLILGTLIGVGGAAVGTLLAVAWNATTAGTVCGVMGAAFAASFVASPRGLAAHWVRRRRQRLSFYDAMLLVHLASHEGGPEEAHENGAPTVHEHLHWPRRTVERVVRRAAAGGYIEPVATC